MKQNHLFKRIVNFILVLTLLATAMVPTAAAQEVASIFPTGTPTLGDSRDPAAAEEVIKPTQATEPVETTEPVKNTEPEETTEPVKNTEPEKAAEPAKTTKPEEVTEPVKATEPVKTAEPEKATEPEETPKPEETTGPEEDTEPVETTEPEETTPPDSDDDFAPSLKDSLDIIMASNPEDADEPNFIMPKLPDSTYHKEFSYQNGVTLSGIFETHSLYFEVPEYWDCNYAYARIEFTLSQLIRGDIPASLTFMVNNIPIYTCRVDYDYGRDQIIYVSVPVELLQEGYNTFSITGYVRIYDEEGCIDDFSGANWVHISEKSFLDVGYELKPHNNWISYYPYPFMSTIDPNGENAQVVVSDAQDNSELAAALLLRADLAAETDLEDHIALTTVSGMRSAATVLVSLLKNLPEQYASLLSTEERTSIRMNAAAFVKFTEANGQPLLIITSNDENSLMEAAMMLVDESRVDQEDASSCWVLSNASQIIKEAASQNDLASGHYTMEGLTGGGLHFIGPFHRESIVYLPFSGGYVLAGSSKISLNFRYSENLNFDRSMITVYWGNLPVASKKLTKELAGGDSLSFVMPTDVIGTSATSIRIAFDLELPELFCTPRMEEMPWAYVTADSTLYLPLGVTGQLSFSLRPFPFEESSQFNDLLVVIPDSPSATELDTLGQIIAAYGESVTAYGDIAVQRCSQFRSSGNDVDKNIIVLGTWADNSLIQELNPRLSFPYNGSGSAFESNEELILSETYANRIAMMQLLPSEYATARSILVVGGVDDRTVGLVNSFLQKDKNVWKLAGDTVLLDGSDEVKSFTFQDVDRNITAPTLKDYLAENEQTVIFTVTATAAMLLLFLGCLLVLLRVYGRSKENRDK